MVLFLSTLPIVYFVELAFIKFLLFSTVLSGTDQASVFNSEVKNKIEYDYRLKAWMCPGVGFWNLITCIIDIIEDFHNDYKDLPDE